MRSLPVTPFRNVFHMRILLRHMDELMSAKGGRMLSRATSVTARLWRGEMPLRVTFLGFGIVGLVLIQSLSLMVLFIPTEIVQGFAIKLVRAVSLVFFAVASVSIWRSAGGYLFARMMKQEFCMLGYVPVLFSVSLGFSFVFGLVRMAGGL